MALKLDLLPDKPVSLKKKTSVLNFDLLPDKPKGAGQKSILDLDLLPDKPKESLVKFSPSLKVKPSMEQQVSWALMKTAGKGVLQAGVRYPRAAFRGLEALQTGEPPIEAMKKGFVPEVYEQDKKVKSPVEIAWDMADRMYGNKSTSVTWEFIKTLPFTTAGVVGSFKLDPSIFLVFKGLNSIITNPLVAKYLGKDIPAPKWFDNAIKNSIKYFHRPLETFAENVKTNRIEALTEEAFKRIRPMVETNPEFKAKLVKAGGGQFSDNDLRGYIKKEFIRKGLYEVGIKDIQARINKIKKMGPLGEAKPAPVEPTPTTPPVTQPVTQPVTPPVTPTIPTTQPPVVPEVAKPPIAPPEPISAPKQPIVEGKQAKVGDTVDLYGSDQKGEVTNIEYDSGSQMNMYSIKLENGESTKVSEEVIMGVKVPTEPEKVAEQAIQKAQRKIPTEIEQKSLNLYGEGYSKLCITEKKKVLLNTPGHSFIVTEKDAISLAKTYPGYDIKACPFQTSALLSKESSFATDGKYLITDSAVAKIIQKDYWDKVRANSIKDSQKKGLSYADAVKLAEVEMKTLGEQKAPEIKEIAEKIKNNATKPLEFIGIKSSDYENPMSVYSDGQKHYILNSKYVKFIKKHFPEAIFKGSDPDSGLAIYDKSVFKGVVLPMKGLDTDLPLTLKQPTQKEQVKTAKEPTGKKSSGRAFAEPEGGLEEWIKKQSESQNLKLKGLEMPELVKLAVNLQGKYPIVRKLIRKLGLFKFGKGIALDVNIFKDPKLAGMVLAHEIGHLIDWLPNFVIARGNILGRIATLRNYLKSLLPESPKSGFKILTEQDKTRLAKEASKQIREEYKLCEREIIEEIIREIPIYEGALTVDEVLSIWRASATTIRISNPGLYDFIAKLSSAEKGAIVRQAMRGILDERLAKFGKGKQIGVKVVKEQIRRTVSPELSKSAIRKRLKELIEKEIKKRKLFKESVIKEELKRVTQWWNPFDDTRKGWFTKYRYSSVELYAEAISVMLNYPEKLEEIAPTFYKAFWNYIDSKPDVKKALIELQDFLNMSEGEKLRIRSEDIKTMFKKGEELFYEKRNEYKAAQKSLAFKLKTELIDKNMALLNKVKEAVKQGKVINPEDNPKYYLEEWNYIGGKVKNLLGDIDSEVVNPLTSIGITQEDLGEYLFLNRVTTERKEVANPLGFDRKTAQDQLKYLLDRLGQEKFDALRYSVEKFQSILKKLLQQAEKAGLYKPETIKELITNKDYATFQVLDYLDDYVSPSVIKQVGTLKPIANPFASTTLKMISTLRSIERVKTNNSVIKFLGKYFPKEILLAKTKRFGKYKTEIIEKEGYGVIKTLRDGKLVGYYVDPYIADSVNHQPASRSNAVVSIFKFLNSSYFRPVYVNFNLGFQTFNLMRDFVRAWKLNPDVNFPKMIKAYTQAMPIAKRRIWGDFTDPVIYQMQQSGMLSFTYNKLMRGADDETTQVEFLMKQFDILKKNPKNPVMKVLNFIEEIGDFIETIPKVTGYLSRLKSGRNIKEIAHEVRIFSGSPDFLRKGTGYGWYNNIFLFANAMKEGFRGDFEGAFKNPRTRSGYWWRTAKLNLLPKILMFLATLGFFGKRIKENYDKQTEFDKTNYTTIPLGQTEDDQAIYLRLPHDEVGRVLSSILWKVMNFRKGGILKSLQQIGSIAAGQLPSVTPVIDMITAITQYAVGQNPYDFFRGESMLTPDEMKAGGWYSLKPFLRWMAGKLGVYGLTVRARRESESVFEKIVRFTPIIQRYIRITAYGEEETKRREKLDRETFKAERRLERR